MKILDNEIIDDLQLKGLKLIQKKNGFKFGIDAVLLSDFVQIDKNAKVFDIGTGTGILPVLLYGKDKGDTFFGIDIQEDMIEMAQRSAVLNGIEDYVRFVLCDVKDTNSRFEGGSFDAVVTNPPYMKAGDGLLNPNPAKAVSRHEVACTIDDILKASHYLLKEKGKLFMVHRPHRLLDIFEAMRKYKIEPKRMRFVYPQMQKEPNLVLLCGVKYGKQELRVEKPLFVYDENNQYTEEVRKIYLRT
jgi:tRNA1Val (adenine37-N6)-methyltransferase